MLPDILVYCCILLFSITSFHCYMLANVIFQKYMWHEIKNKKLCINFPGVYYPVALQLQDIIYLPLISRGWLSFAALHLFSFRWNSQPQTPFFTLLIKLVPFKDATFDTLSEEKLGPAVEKWSGPKPGLVVKGLRFFCMVRMILRFSCRWRILSFFCI